MSEQQNNNQLNGLQIAMGNKKVRATGLIALILVLSIGPLTLALYLNSKMVEAVGKQAEAFTASLKVLGDGLNLQHHTIETRSEEIHKAVDQRHVQIYEQLSEQTYILSLSDAQRGKMKLTMPASLCKKLERQRC